jgi:predicted NAD/FAD-dependent oxidoreductase
LDELANSKTYVFLEGRCIDNSPLHWLFTNRTKKRRLKKNLKLLFIFLEAFRDPFVAAVEAASQSSLGTKANLHKGGGCRGRLTSRRISRVYCLPGASANFTTDDAFIDSTVSNLSKAEVFNKDHLPLDYQG